MKHPMQGVVVAGDGIVRFKVNAIVRHLLDNGPFDLNHLARLGFSNDDWSQFAQLIGYSVSGFGELDYANRDDVARADERAATLLKPART